MREVQEDLITEGALGVPIQPQVRPLRLPSVAELATTESTLSRSARPQEGAQGHLSPILRKLSW